MRLPSSPRATQVLSAALDLPIVASNVTGRTEAAFGDLGVRGSWIPWIGQSRGVLVGVDTVWSTATNEALGDGRPGSLHDHIVKQWGYIRSYVVRDGHLFLALMADGGIYELEPVEKTKP